MQQFRITDQIRESFGQGELLDVLMKELKCGILITGKNAKQILYMNPQAVEFLIEHPQTISTVKIDDLFSGNEVASIERNQTFRTEIMEKKLEIRSIASQQYNTLFLRDITKLEDIVEESDNLKKLNRQLQSVYEQYSDDTICITDENGIVEFAGEACYRHCGITSGDIIGMNIFELEKKKYFYPAATVKVFASKKNEVVMSDTQIGVTLITIGVPVFNEQGEIRKVISISRDFSKEVEIASLLAEVKSDIWMEENREEDDNTIVTCSSKIYSIMTLMRMVASTDSTVMLEGETGTGKGIFAQYIHRKSKRWDKPFVVVNCGAIAENLIESELFGYETGTFTGGSKEGKIGLLELARGGTLFLDEIGELPLSQQVKLLHVLQDKRMMRVGGREYIDLDFRVIVATNKDLEKMVQEGNFREDLFYRISVVCAKVPRLEERREDIPLLVKHFTERMNERNGTNKEISQKAIAMMSKYEWPGNVRELENAIEMLCVTTRRTIIDVNDLPRKIVQGGTDAFIAPMVEVKGVIPLKAALQETEQNLISLALKECGGNQQQVAELLGVDRSTITRKINQYGIKAAD